MFASGTGIAEVFDHCVKVRPYILATNKFYGFVLSKVTRKDVIMIVLDDFKSEVHRIGDIDSVILVKKSRLIDCPVGSVGSRNLKVGSRNGIIGEGFSDVIIKFLGIQNNSISNDGGGKIGCVE